MGGFRSLKDEYPELAKEWHPTKNGSLTPEQVTAGSGRVVWWMLSYDDPKTDRHFNFEWEAAIRCRALRKHGCPYLSGKAVCTGFNDLATTHPKLTQEWHPTKNGDLTPEQVSAGSTKKVWWMLPYDDPKTGRHFDFEWEAVIANRTRKGDGCPYLSGKAVLVGFNDLATTHPNLTREWHPTKNGDLTPEQVSAGSGKKVWWMLPYDDPKTGKHFDFEWPAVIASRAHDGIGCPYLSGKAVWAGFNDLATTHPKLTQEWHPTKNGDLTPEQVSAGSTKKVWWMLPYDDPKTGKHFDFEWPAVIESRALYGMGCPYLSGNAVCTGFNDLATTHPKLIQEWHPTKNGDLTPEQVSAGSNIKVWWMLPYDDPKTGRHFDFEWEAVIANRTRKGDGCPYLSGKAVWAGFNDLATTHLILIQEWHPTKNGDLTPEQVSAGSKKKVWWMLSYDDPKTGKHFDFEWVESILNRAINNYGCPYLSGKAVLVGFNDLATTHPKLTQEWHPTKNGDLTPEQVSAGSGKKVWWMLPYDDPKAGKHFDFEWPAVIESRAHDDLGCPYLSGKAVWAGFNDLATTHPKLTQEWHPTKNGDLTPEQVSAGSNIKVWWMLPYDDPKTGKHFDFEWPAVIESRAHDEMGCPYLSGNAVCTGFNDLVTVNSEIAYEFNQKKNHGISPYTVPAGSPHKYWWKCQICGAVWRTAVVNRIKNGSGCPNYRMHPKSY